MEYKAANGKETGNDSERGGGGGGTDLDLDKTDGRFRSGNAEVAGSRKLGSAADRRAVNHSNANQGQPAFGRRIHRKMHGQPMEKA